MCTTCTPTCGCPATKPFDPTKPVQLRNGTLARIICTDLKGASCSIVIAYVNSRGTEEIGSRHSNGRINAGAEGPRDLVNVPERTVRFVNFDGTAVLRGSEDRYDVRGFSRTVDVSPGNAEYRTLKLTFEDGKLISSEVVR